MSPSPGRTCLALLAAVAALASVAQAGSPRTMRQVGLCYTGFGVPGSGRPYVFGDRVLVNAGEGYPTLIDVSDRHRPKVLRHIPSWFFTSILYPLPSRDLVYLSSSRGPLLVLRGLKTLDQGGEPKEIAWKREWGRSSLSALRPDGIGYTVVGEHILVLDLKDPGQPKELARLHQARLKGHGQRWPGGLLAFSPNRRLAALTVDKGRRILVLRWDGPAKPVVCAEIENILLTDSKGASAHGRALAMDEQRLVIGHPASTSRYWRCAKLTFWDISDPRQPERASEMAFPDRGTHIRDLALAGRYAYVVDGRNIHSGHTVRRSQHSRLIVLDLRDLAAPTTVATFTEAMPTEFSKLTLSGETLFVNDYDYGLWLFDVSDPRKPLKLGGAPVSAEGHWLYLKDDHAFVAHTFGGTIHVINVAEPAKPRTVGYYWDGQWLNYKAKIRGKAEAMYLPQFDGLAIVDIAEPRSPERVGEFLDAAGQPLFQPCIDVAGERAFVATARLGKTPGRLLVYDVASPLAPRLVSTTDLPDGKGYRVLAADGRLYLVRFTGARFLIIDVADPKTPRITADLNAQEARLGDRAVSLVVRDGGGNGAPGLAFSRGYLYVVTGKPAPDNPYLLIFDVRDPKALRLAGTLDVTDRKGWQYFVCDVIVQGNRLILGDYGCDEVYDLTDPLKPRRLAQYRRSYAWQVGTVRGHHLFVPKLDGLEILELP